MEPAIETERTPRSGVRHPSPPLGALATVFTLLHLASIACVFLLAERPPFPAPRLPAEEVASYFRLHPSTVMAFALLLFGAAAAPRPVPGTTGTPRSVPSL